MKILDAKILMGIVLFLTPFLETENHFSKSCLISAIDLTNYTLYGKVHWVTLLIILPSIFCPHNIFKNKFDVEQVYFNKMAA